MYRYKTNMEDPLAQFDTVGYGISNVIMTDEFTIITSSRPIPGFEEIDLETYQSLLPEPVEIEPVEPPTPEPTQLDRIEEKLNQSQAEIANAAIDAYTMELMESGVL